MKATRLVIEGSDLRSLPNILEKELKEAGAGATLFLDSWNDVYICTIQESYLRIEGYVATVTVLNLKENGRCEVQIVQAKGSIGLGFGAEKAAANKVEALFEKICRDNSWRIEGKKELI